MQKKSVGISILTNGNKLECLKRCVESFLANCYYRPLVFGIFDNGSTDDTSDWLGRLPSAYGVEWRTQTTDGDMGCAAGTNVVSELVRDCEYVIHIESDFEHLPENLTSEDKMWLHRALEFMDGGECDYLYLRRMINEKDIFMHGWSNWMSKISVSSSPYLRCDDFWWSNNPHLRRNNAIYKSGCLPLDESIDGKKGETGWSRPELTASRPGKAWIHQWGLFVHDRPCGDLTKFAGCGIEQVAGVGCKYGFFKSGMDMFCQCCDREKGFEDMPEHASRYKELW